MILELCTPYLHLPASATRLPIPGGRWIISTWDIIPGGPGPTPTTARISIHTTFRFFTLPGTGIHITGTVDIMPGRIPTGIIVTGAFTVLHLVATMGETGITVSGFPAPFQLRLQTPGNISGALPGRRLVNMAG